MADPWAHTLRELNWIAETKLEHAWNHTATLAAAMGRAMGAKWKPADFHPMKPQGTTTKKVPLTVLRDLFVDKNPKKVLREHGNVQ